MKADRLLVHKGGIVEHQRYAHFILLKQPVDGTFLEPLNYLRLVLSKAVTDFFKVSVSSSDKETSR